MTAPEKPAGLAGLARFQPRAAVAPAAESDVARVAAASGFVPRSAPAEPRRKPRGAFKEPMMVVTLRIRVRDNDAFVAFQEEADLATAGVAFAELMALLEEERARSPGPYRRRTGRRTP